jgi:hypothetical protein
MNIFGSEKLPISISLSPSLCYINALGTFKVPVPFSGKSRMSAKLQLALLPETLAICRLEIDAQVPAWGLDGSFVNITRTEKELSIVCPQSQVPDGVKRDEGWRCLKVQETLDVSVTGVLASLTTPLAFEGISVFAISTYDTDYFLVKQRFLEKAMTVLIRSGHHIEYPQGG